MNAKQNKAALKKSAQEAEHRRPAVNPQMPGQAIEKLIGEFNSIRSGLENYAAHLRALDRKRLNGIGIKTQGFIDRSFEYAAENPDFLPHYLPVEKFREDHDYFVNFRILLELERQLHELLWNITLQAADVVYTDSLEFYAMVREAAKRRVDTSETIYKDLGVFFKKRKRTEGKPTMKEFNRDANALMKGKRDGRIVIENIKPKLTGGSHRVIDEKYSDGGQFKETKEGEGKE